MQEIVKILEINVEQNKHSPMLSCLFNRFCHTLLRRQQSSSLWYTRTRECRHVLEHMNAIAVLSIRKRSLCKICRVIKMKADLYRETRGSWRRVTSMWWAICLTLVNKIFHNSRLFQVLFTEKVKNFYPLKSRLPRIAARDDPGKPRKAEDRKIVFRGKFFIWTCSHFSQCPCQWDCQDVSILLFMSLFIGVLQLWCPGSPENRGTISDIKSGTVSTAVS